MIDFKALSCPVCKERFDCEGDIVVCPVCGAPHHRQCWNEVGHCSQEDTHYTQQQYQRPEPKSEQAEDIAICPRCGRHCQVDSLFCPNCGLPLGESQKSQYEQQAQRNFDGGTFVDLSAILSGPLGGVNPNEQIDGIPITDVATFVGSRSNYYIPRFVLMQKNNRKFNFNLSAALFNTIWFLYRRMLLPFLFVGALFFVINLATIALQIYSYGGIEPFLQAFFADNVVEPIYSPTVRYLLTALSFMLYAVMFLLGGFGNFLYYRHTVKKIKRLRKQYPDNADYHMALASKGSVKLEYILALLGIVSFSYFLLFLL